MSADAARGERVSKVMMANRRLRVKRERETETETEKEKERQSELLASESNDNPLVTKP
jgi:hypothetical protein